MTDKRSPELVETLSNLIAQHPFLAVYLFDIMKIRETDDLPTAATDGRTIMFNPKFFSKLQLPERVFLVAHEVLHGIYQHCPRMKAYQDRGFGPDLKPWDQMKYNRAADYVINDMLGRANIGRMPEGGLHRPDVDMTMLVDDVYCTLPDDDQPPNQQPFDDHLPPDPNNPPPSDAEVQRAVTSAKNAAKAQGKMPGALERLVQEIVEPTQDWKALLRDMMTATAGKDQATWARPNRRRLAMAPHIYMPGSTGFQTGGVAIVIDTSGSVSPAELNAFMGEVSGILSECKPEWCKVLWTDSRVAGVDEVDDPEQLTSLTAKGGGGTNMGAAFEYMDAHDITPERCVVLTDGYTPWGEPQPYDVIWGITADNITAEHGKSLHIKVNQ